MLNAPSAWSIIRTDNVCWAITSGSPVLLLIGLLVKFTGTVPGRRGGPDIPIDPDAATMVLAGAVALMLLLSAVVARRVAGVRNLLDRGREVQATVRKVTYFPRGGRQKLDLEFELDGLRCSVSSAFTRWPSTPAFTEGTRIAVVVDPLNPKRVIPTALYAHQPSGLQSA